MVNQPGPPREKPEPTPRPGGPADTVNERNALRREVKRLSGELARANEELHERPARPTPLEAIDAKREQVDLEAAMRRQTLLEITGHFLILGFYLAAGYGILGLWWFGRLALGFGP